MHKIKSIQTVLSDDNYYFIVGESGVTNIKDMTWESDERIVPIYGVWKGEELWFKVEGLPVLLSYFTKD